MYNAAVTPRIDERFMLSKFIMVVLDTKITDAMIGYNLDATNLIMIKCFSTGRVCVFYITAIYLWFGTGSNVFVLYVYIFPCIIGYRYRFLFSEM